MISNEKIKISSSTAKLQLWGYHTYNVQKQMQTSLFYLYPYWSTNIIIIVDTYWYLFRSLQTLQ